MFDSTHQPAGNSGRQFRPESAEFVWWAIRCQNQLPTLAKQRVDRVLEFNERCSLAGKELDVVDRQYIDFSTLASKAGQAAPLQRIQKVAGELFRGQ